MNCNRDKLGDDSSAEASTRLAMLANLKSRQTVIRAALVRRESARVLTAMPAVGRKVATMLTVEVNGVSGRTRFADIVVSSVNRRVNLGDGIVERRGNTL